MNRLIQQTLHADNAVTGFVTDVFNLTTIALASVLGLLTIAATI